MGGMSQGMHLRLQTDRETVDVHLGPVWQGWRQRQSN
jgi:hypothetical protein